MLFCDIATVYIMCYLAYLAKTSHFRFTVTQYHVNLNEMILYFRNDNYIYVIILSLMLLQTMHLYFI